MRSFSFIALGFLLNAGTLLADPLTGDVSAAYPTLDSLEQNPGNASFLDRTQVSVAPEIFKTETIYARYPGFESASLAESGVGNLLVKPAFIFKLSPRLALGGYVIPPLGLSIDIRKERLPVYILDTLNYVDLFGKGRLNGAAQALVGYRISSRFGIGVSGDFQSVGFDADLVPSDGGATLAKISGDITSASAKLGLRYQFSSALSMGLSFGLFSQSSQDIKFESSLLPADSSGGGATGGGSAMNPADSFLVGVEALPSSKLRMMLDVKYQRANKNQQSFSLVDLKTKRRDVYDTVAIRSGMIFGMSPTYNALLGFRYEPSDIGPGSKGEDGTAGFGTIDLVSIFAGFDELKPYYQYSAGIRLYAGWVSERGGRKHSELKGYYAWEAAMGLVYRIASLGIDENGELPGAYLQKKVFIPLTILRKI